MNWIFGYGSLINSDSRKKTGNSGKVIPVRITGLKRQWNVVIDEIKVTAVGVTLAKDSLCNGIVCQVDNEDLLKFDKREIPFGYSRIEIDKKNITPLLGFNLPKGIFWVYAANKPGKPSSESPIIQSYIDVILTGCLEYSEQFARNFVKNTEFWNYPWINDRKNPRYPRALSNPDVKKIDSILREEITKEFLKRQDV